METKNGAWTPGAMREELHHALVQALHELDSLPRTQDGALQGIHAVLRQLEAAIHRTQRLDSSRAN